MRCAIYARVSLEEQAQQYGLSSQLHACREYAKVHGYTVLEEFSDDASGATLDRPALDRLRNGVRAGLFDVVVIYDTDRLSRELAHLFILKPEIEKKARIEFVAAKFEDSPSGRLFFGMRGVISQFEREQIRERTLRGRRQKAREGNIVGGRVPFGYRYLGKAEGQRGRFEINDQTAATVRKIFDLYDHGASIRDITKQLRDQGAPSWGGKTWGKSSVRRILINETYAGTAHYGTHKREGSRLIVKANADRISIEVPAIIERCIWDRVQARLAENPKTGRPSRRYLLRGLLYCACGQRMNGDPSHGYPVYRCHGRDGLKLERCQCRVLARRIDETVWTSTSVPFRNPRKLVELVTASFGRLKVDTGDGNQDRLRFRIKALSAKEDRAIALLLELPASSAVLTAQLQKIQAERNKLQAEFSRVEARQHQGIIARESIQTMAEEISSVVRNLKVNRQEFLQRTVERVTFDGTAAESVCFLSQNRSQREDDRSTFEQGSLDNRIRFTVRALVA